MAKKKTTKDEAPVSEERRGFIAGAVAVVAGAAVVAAGGTAAAGPGPAAPAGNVRKIAVRNTKLQTATNELIGKVQSSQLDAAVKNDFVDALRGADIKDLVGSFRGIENNVSINVTVAGNGTISVD